VTVGVDAEADSRFTVAARIPSLAARIEPSNVIETFLDRLHEAREVSVYGSIERLVQAGEAVGLDANTLMKMLDQGMTFQELLELIEAKMECLQKTA
jgi:hypothetical protein